MASGATLALSLTVMAAFIISTSATPRAPIGAATRSWTVWCAKQKTVHRARLPTDLLLPLMEKHDKEWAAIHPTKGTIALSWTQFDAYGTSDENCKSTILFSESNDGGQSWSEPVVITEQQGDCIDDDGTSEGAVPAYGIKNARYVGWVLNGGIYFNRSLDGKTGKKFAWPTKRRLDTELSRI